MVQPSLVAMEYFNSKYKEEYCTQLLEHCASGRSIETFAAKINVIPHSFMYWAELHPEFEVCLLVAHWKSLAWWEDRIVEDQSYIKELKTLQPGLVKLVMENRFKWCANHELPRHEVERMSMEELEKRARDILMLRDSKDDEKINKQITKIEKQNE